MPEELVEFSADAVTYDTDSDIVTANGAVRMSREGNYLAADQVVWNRKSGEVRALGNVVVVTPQGDKLVGDNVVLTDTLRDGTVDNLLVVLESGGRIAATRGRRNGEVITLENAIYSPCPVTSSTGCPRSPSWSITAAQVIRDPAKNRVSFRGGRFQLFGINLPLLPVFSINTSTGGSTGWLAPDFSISSKKGFEVAVPYHWQIGSNRDFTVTPHLYTGVWPALEAKYRQLDRYGAFQIGGFLTYGSRAPTPTRRRTRVAAFAPMAKQTASGSSTRCGASRRRFARRPTRPSPGDTTSRATTACETSSMRSGSAQTAT